MESLALEVVSVLAALSFAVMLYDAVGLLRSALKRRRRARTVGMYGVVVDHRGKVLGTYQDPFVQIARPARLLEPDSPWAEPGPDGRGGWAWEGFGESEEEARLAANRLRRLHLSLRPELSEGEDEENLPPYGVQGPPR